VERYQTLVGAGASRHDTLVACLAWGCKEVIAGNISARRMTSELRAVHLTALADSNHPNGAAPSRRDFNDALRWALAQARMDPLSDTMPSNPATKVPTQPSHNPQNALTYADVGESADIAELQTAFDKSVPTALERGTALPDFPVDVLPDPIAAMVRSVADTTQTDAGMAGVVALGVMAAAAGGYAEVQVKPGYCEPTNLWVMAVASPGERKSAVCKLMTAPLAALEADLVRTAQPLIDEQRVRQEIAEKITDTAKRQAGKAAADDRDRITTEALAAAADASNITVDTVPRIIVDDITPEALGSRLAEQGGRLAVVSTEGGLLSTAAGRYRPNPDLSVLLNSHAGDPIRVDRRSRPTEFVDKPALTVVMMVQPGVLATTSSRNPTFYDSGFLARFLFSFPPSFLGQRDVDPKPIDHAVIDAYGTQPTRVARSLRSTTEVHQLTLDAEARTDFLDYSRQEEVKLGPNGELDHIGGWASKLRGAVVRLAGLLQLMRDGAATHTITGHSMLGAVALAEYFTAHALHAFDIMAGRGDDLETSRRVLALIARNPEFAEFSARDLLTAAPRSWMPNTEAMNAALGQLVDYGWIIQLPERARSGGKPGRDPSSRFRAHPRCHQEAPQNPHK